MRAGRTLPKRRQQGYLLLELMVASVVLAVATSGIMSIFLMAQSRGMYSILQNNAVTILREEVETVLATPHEDLDSNYQTGQKVVRVQQLDLMDPYNPTPNPNPNYPIEIRWEVISFPNAFVKREPDFKIVNVYGVWSYRGTMNTNVLQTISVP